MRQTRSSLASLGGLQPGLGVVPDGAGVDHRGAEHELVEVVAHVVVVGDRGGVPVAGVPPATGRGCLLGRGSGLGTDRPQPERDAQQGQPVTPGPVRRRLLLRQPAVGAQRGEGRVDVVLHVDLAGDVGPADAELARRPEHPAQRPARPHRDHRCAVGTGDRAVPPAQPHRQLRRPQHCTQGRCQPVRDRPACHVAPPAPGRNQRTPRASTRRCCATNFPRNTERPLDHPGCPAERNGQCHRSQDDEAASSDSTSATEVIRWTANVRFSPRPSSNPCRKPPTSDTGATTRWLPLPCAST